MLLCLFAFVIALSLILYTAFFLHRCHGHIPRSTTTIAQSIDTCGRCHDGTTRLILLTPSRGASTMRRDMTDTLRFTTAPALGSHSPLISHRCLILDGLVLNHLLLSIMLHNCSMTSFHIALIESSLDGFDTKLSWFIVFIDIILWSWSICCSETSLILLDVDRLLIISKDGCVI